MNSFRSDNTDGYSQKELDSLNEEWKKIVNSLNLEEHTDEYDFQEKKFADEVARR